MEQESLLISFRMIPRGGAESSQWDDFMDNLGVVSMSTSPDTWSWSLSRFGGFFVASVMLT